MPSENTAFVRLTSEQLAEIAKNARAMRQIARETFERAQEAVRLAEKTVAGIKAAMLGRK